jgi:hypothetical protein
VYLLGLPVIAPLLPGFARTVGSIFLNSVKTYSGLFELKPSECRVRSERAAPAPSAKLHPRSSHLWALGCYPLRRAVESISGSDWGFGIDR